MTVDLSDYKDVSQRLADFRAKHPEGCLRPVDPMRPFWFETVEGQTFVCYAAAAYRAPDDSRPGIGVAWEPVPGKTPYTRLSELQNAETSAWGRAIVAVLASESRSVASAEDVRNRNADNEPPARPARQRRPASSPPPLTETIKALPDGARAALRTWCQEHEIPAVVAQMSELQQDSVREHIEGLQRQLQHRRSVPALNSVPPPG